MPTRPKPPPGRREAVLPGGRLRALRLARGLSLADLGAALGVSAAQIHKYETGATRLSAAMLVRLAPQLGVPASRILSDEAPPPSAQSAEVAALLAEPGAADLLRSFTALPRGPLRAAVLDLLRAWRTHRG